MTEPEHEAVKWAFFIIGLIVLAFVDWRIALGVFLVVMGA